MTLLGLRVRGLAPGEPYDMDVEIAAVSEAAGSGPVHLAGFSAGATVALAAALALGDPVRSVALLEPAFIGDDDWHPAETRWRAAIGSLRATATAEQVEGFRAMLVAPGVPPPASRGPVAWDFRDDLLAAMLTTRTGFESADLARLQAPILLIGGGRSSPRFGRAARRLIAVCPRASEHVFPRSTTSRRPTATSPGSSRASCPPSGHVTIRDNVSCSVAYLDARRSATSEVADAPIWGRRRPVRVGASAPRC